MHLDALNVTPEPSLLSSWQSTACAAARAAGDHLRGRFGGAETISESRHDIKLAEDRSSEALIVAYLRQAHDLTVLCEEAGWIGGAPPGGDEPYWVVDPLDGSFNFARGVPLCCVSIALCRGRKPILGVVHDFLRGELLVGGAALHLTINGQLAGRRPDRAGVLATGLPTHGDHSLQLEEIGKARKVRMLGSAALSLAWVAAGRLDRYAENGIMWWDVAAGLALVEAAGGSHAVGPGALDGPLDIWAERGAGGDAPSEHPQEAEELGVA